MMKDPQQHAGKLQSQAQNAGHWHASTGTCATFNDELRDSVAGLEKKEVRHAVITVINCYN